MLTETQRNCKGALRVVSREKISDEETLIKYKCHKCNHTAESVVKIKNKTDKSTT